MPYHYRLHESVVPWRDLPAARLDRSRLIVVANTDVNWSLAECEYYCSQRRIPLANIVTMALGNGGSPSVPPAIYAAGTAANVISTVITPVSTKARTIFATGVLLGPGVPVGCQFPDAFGVQQVAYMGDVMGMVGWPGRTAIDNSFPPYTAADLKTSSVSGFVNLQTGSTFPVRLGRDVYLTTKMFPGLAPVTPVPGEGLRIDTVWPLSSLATLADVELRAYRMHTYGATLAIGHPICHYNQVSAPNVVRCAPSIPSGRIGAASLGGGFLGGPGFTETQAWVRDLIDRTTSLMAIQQRNEALVKPVLFNLTHSDGATKTAVKWSYLRWLCERWGMNTRYAYLDSSLVDQQARDYSPTISASYTGVQLLGGGVVDFPYYMMLGGWDNIDFYSAPYADAWKPLPGGGVMMGPSNGFQAGNRALGRGASCVRTDAVHTITRAISEEPVLFHNLLRGMSWLEAIFLGGCSGSYPCGDPLWAPYGEADRAAVPQGRRRASLFPRLRSR